MTSALENLCGPNQPLVAEPADAKEFEGLKRSGKTRLRDAKNSQVSLEERFIVFQVLPHTKGISTSTNVWCRT